LSITFKAGLRYILLFLLGLTAIYFVFKGQNQKEIFSYIKHANYYWIALSALIVLCAHLVRALRWQMLINALGKPISLSSTFYAVMIGYLANLAFPRLGEVSRCGVLKKKVDLSFTELFGTVITERLVDLISLLIVAMITIALQYQLIYASLHELLRSKTFNYETLWFIVLVFFIFIITIYWIYIKNTEHPFVKKIIAFLMDLKKGLYSISKLKNSWLFIGYSTLMWTLYILSVYIAFQALPTTYQLGMNAAFCVIVFGSLGMIAPVQGGIGAFHFMVTKALQFYGVETESGITIATLMHSSQTFIIIVIGFLSLFLILKKSNQPWETGFVQPAE
jgi:uncharacterized protein (TIRG00374 family)